MHVFCLSLISNHQGYISFARRCSRRIGMLSTGSSWLWWVPWFCLKFGPLGLLLPLLVSYAPSACICVFLQIEQTVWSWVRGAAQNAAPAFLKNKIAQNAACILQVWHTVLRFLEPNWTNITSTPQISSWWHA